MLTGCAPVDAPTKPSPSIKPGAPTTDDWSALGTSLVGKLATPASSTYDQVRLTQNPRWDAAKPLAVLTAASPTDVAFGLSFAIKHSLPLALRSGGHSYPGYSAGSGALVIDSRALNTVVVNGDSSVTIGAGASLAQIYSQLGKHELAIAGGSCPTVGIAGLTLGGGIGVVSRAFGLTCDALTEIEIVTADGSVTTASATKNPELFWACRGGGGGHLGVVTALTFATKPAPTVMMFSLSWPYASAGAVISAFQTWAVTADRQAWGTLKLLNGPGYPAGPGVFISGTWLGSPTQIEAILAPLIAAAKPKTKTIYTHTYAAAMANYAGCANIPVAECTTDPGGKLTRQAFAATSHLAYKPLTASAITTLLQQVTAAGTLPGVTEAGISMDALGGAIADLAPDATAFPHRAAIMSLQYTATFATGADPDPFDTYVRGFRAALVPSLGIGAYVNYADSSLANPAQAYFGANAARLAQVRAKYDPQKVFTQPQGY